MNDTHKHMSVVAVNKHGFLVMNEGTVEMLYFVVGVTEIIDPETNVPSLWFVARTVEMPNDGINLHNPNRPTR
jgi:hypothetical protein